MDYSPFGSFFTTAFDSIVILLPAFVKLGAFVIVIAAIRIGWDLLVALVSGAPSESIPENAVHGEWSSCPICGLRHGANYKGTHPRTE